MSECRHVFKDGKTEPCGEEYTEKWIRFIEQMENSKVILTSTDQ